MNNNYATALEKYKEWETDFTRYVTFSMEGMKELFNYIESRGFTTLPASLRHHLSYQGGLLIHSVNVAESLIELTEKLNLKWQRPESPIVVGLFHDLCKLEFYKQDGDKFVYNDDAEFNLGGHGMLSVVLAQMFIKLTDEEIHCIRFHMGAYEQKDWSMFDAAIRKYPNVLYTHTADMIASKIIER